MNQFGQLVQVKPQHLSSTRNAFLYQKLILEKYGSEISETIKIVYGSCNKNNAKDLFKQKDIDVD